MKQRNDRQYYHVVTLGQTNSGKSMVLSALAGQKDLFPSHDCPRKTRRIQREIVGPLLLIDTPGLDANDKDSGIAMEEVISADTVLWCHSLRAGEFRELEVAALKQYARLTGTIWKTCFVLTHSDDLANKEVRQIVSKRIADQLYEIFKMIFWSIGDPPMENKVGTRHPRVFNYLGCEMFWREMRTTKGASSNLLRLSGVPGLRQFLLELARKKISS